ncbi:MAG: hypothetical protein MZV70_03480 [Desulfobacterales bacterium]|nr:hypothetical protein [Desulfobacterales bacterium]
MIWGRGREESPRARPDHGLSRPPPYSRFPRPLAPALAEPVAPKPPRVRKPVATEVAAPQSRRTPRNSGRGWTRSPKAFDFESNGPATPGEGKWPCLTGTTLVATPEKRWAAHIKAEASGSCRTERTVASYDAGRRRCPRVRRKAADYTIRRPSPSRTGTALMSPDAGRGTKRSAVS